MVKSYSKFTYQDIEQLGIAISQSKFLADIPTLPPSAWLKETINIYMAQPKGSEKAKSEYFIAPLLNELAVRNQKQITIYSGYSFRVNPKLGLNGIVDYIISKTPYAPIIKAPVFCVVEAKNDNLELGVPQCVAEMYAARTFNAEQGRPTETVFGCVTYGLAWQFLRLNGSTCHIDPDIFTLSRLPELLGVLQHIVDAN